MPNNSLQYLNVLTGSAHSKIDWHWLEEIQLLRSEEKSKEKSEKKHEPYNEILSDLPQLSGLNHNFHQAVVQIGQRSEIDNHLFTECYKKAKALMPWRKGPFDLFGIHIDSEWRSDLKWDRIEKLLPDLEGKSVLDIGCNNGYFLFRMAQKKASLLLGLDPILHCYTQMQFLQHFARVPEMHMERWGIEHVKAFTNCFDVIICMGVIYHHQSPIDQLKSLYQALKPNGLLILESIGIQKEGSYALFPEGRYSNMRNVWFVPTRECLINWTKRSGFKSTEFVGESQLTSHEQRSTEWSSPVSLKEQLDPNDDSKTIEGHLAPWRFIVTATK